MRITRKPNGGTVVEVGRWRIRGRLGRYRFGLHRSDGWSAFSWGLGFCTGNAVRRTRA